MPGCSAFVTFCDINEEKGKELEKELSPEKTAFVKCDTRSWDDQVRMFETAISRSPHHSVDIVIGNAGVGRGAGDPMMALEGMLCRWCMKLDRPSSYDQVLIKIRNRSINDTCQAFNAYIRYQPLRSVIQPEASCALLPQISHRSWARPLFHLWGQYCRLCG